MTPHIPTRIETARLILRTWQPADWAAFAEINSDPEVTEHVGGPAH
ncbi:MAG TPA: GNAT family N-acetyltransferase [Jiangellaceae bacterium]|nr:GNAT family N-acetyltransferase [Jiangellaceae bacterium]